MRFELVVPLRGFEHLKEVELHKIDDIFMKLDAVEDEHISFTLIDPFILRTYDFELPHNVRELLEIKENSNVLIQNVVILQQPIEESYVNFLSPILFNTDTQKAAQIILAENTHYGVAEKISDFLNTK